MRKISEWHQNQRGHQRVKKKLVLLGFGVNCEDLYLGGR